MGATITLARWAMRALMVLALVAGVVLMHHVVNAHEQAVVASESAHHGADAHAGASHGHGSASAGGTDESPGGHDLAHWCAAMILSIGVLLFGLLAVRTGVRQWIVALRSSEVWPRPLRPPRWLAGRTLLMSVCVMRV